MRERCKPKTIRRWVTLDTQPALIRPSAGISAFTRVRRTGRVHTNERGRETPRSADKGAKGSRDCVVPRSCAAIFVLRCEKAGKGGPPSAKNTGGNQHDDRVGRKTARDHNRQGVGRGV